MGRLSVNHCTYMVKKLDPVGGGGGGPAAPYPLGKRLWGAGRPAPPPHSGTVAHVRTDE
jgi:hypothetical protein